MEYEIDKRFARSNIRKELCLTRLKVAWLDFCEALETTVINTFTYFVSAFALMYFAGHIVAYLIIR